MFNGAFFLIGDDETMIPSYNTTAVWCIIKERNIHNNRYVGISPRQKSDIGTLFGHNNSKRINIPRWLVPPILCFFESLWTKTISCCERPWYWLLGLFTYYRSRYMGFLLDFTTTSIHDSYCRIRSRNSTNNHLLARPIDYLFTSWLIKSQQSSDNNQVKDLQPMAAAGSTTTTTTPELLFCFVLTNPMPSDFCGTTCRANILVCVLYFLYRFL